MAGTTCVPNQFRRLVTLDAVSFEASLALGLKPVGTVVSSLSKHLQANLADVDNVGRQGEPSLEQVLALEPDLIIGLDSHRPIYTQLSAIAPTVLVQFDHSGQWQQTFRAVAEALGRSQIAQQIMADYYRRLETFKVCMGDTLEQIQVSVVRIYPNTISLYLRDSFAGTILQDAGLARPPAQDLEAAAAKRLTGNPIQITISRELLSHADGDVMFVWTAEDEAEIEPVAQRQWLTLQQDSLWQKLHAVQQGHVYFVSSYWIGSGPIAANRVVDDLFRYLVGTE